MHVVILGGLLLVFLSVALIIMVVRMEDLIDTWLMRNRVSVEQARRWRGQCEGVLIVGRVTFWIGFALALGGLYTSIVP